MARPFVLVALVLAALCGCTRADKPLAAMTPDELWREKVRVLNTVADAAEADAPQERFDALGVRLGEMVREEKRVSTPDVFRLHEKYTPDMREATRRIGMAMAKRPEVAKKMQNIKYSGK